MTRSGPVPLTLAALASIVLAAKVGAGPVSGNLTGPPGAAAAAVQIDVTCHGEPEKADPPDKPGGADKPGKPDKAAKPDKGPKPAPPKSYKVSAKVPGLYSVNVEQQGDCTLTVLYQGMTASIPLVSEKGSVRYDLVLSIADGKLKLRRQ
jgi:hypothetical protein